MKRYCHCSDCNSWRLKAPLRRSQRVRCFLFGHNAIRTDRRNKHDYFCKRCHEYLMED